LEKVEREVAKELESVEVESIDWWAKFIPTLWEQAAPEELWLLAPPSPSTVAQQAVVPAASPTLPIATAEYGTVVRSGPSGRQPLVRPSHAVELSELAVNSYAFVNIASCVRIEGEAPRAPFPLPCCLVQLPSELPAGFDYKDPKAVLPVKWWDPVDKTYEGKWIVWLHGNRQWRSDIERGSIVLANVGLHDGSNNPRKTLRQRSARVLVGSLRLLPSAD